MSDEIFWRFFPPFFVGLWLAISLLLAWIGGWQKLAGHYGTKQEIAGTRRKKRHEEEDRLEER